MPTNEQKSWDFTGEFYKLMQALVFGGVVLLMFSLFVSGHVFGIK